MAACACHLYSNCILWSYVRNLTFPCESANPSEEILVYSAVLNFLKNI